MFSLKKLIDANPYVFKSFKSLKFVLVIPPKAIVGSLVKCDK